MDNRFLHNNSHLGANAMIRAVAIDFFDWGALC
jgi:hypothetical protein